MSLEEDSFSGTFNRYSGCWKKENGVCYFEGESRMSPGAAFWLILFLLLIGLIIYIYKINELSVFFDKSEVVKCSVKRDVVIVRVRELSFIDKPNKKWHSVKFKVKVKQNKGEKYQQFVERRSNVIQEFFQ